MKNPFAAFHQPPLFVLETLGDILEPGGPQLPPFADRQQHEECLQWADLHYERPVCRHCRRATSRRSAKQLRVESLDDGRDGAGVHVGSLSPRMSLVFSARFLAALTGEERAVLQFLPVDAPKSNEGVFELVGPDQVRPVALVSVAPSGWSCPSCHQACWAYWVPGSRIRMFVRADALPTTPKGVFVLRDVDSHHLVVTAERLATLRSAKVMRGLQAIPLGVLPAELATDSPELPEIEAPQYFEVSE